MSLVEDALRAPRVVLSVMGPHAGEDEEAIFARKMADIVLAGVTFWLHRSPAANPLLARRASHVIFLAPSSPSGARPAVSAQEAKSFSTDHKTWFPLPFGISPVAGQLPAFALMLRFLTICTGRLDLWEYAVDAHAPVRFRLGASTVVAQRERVTKGMASRVRRVLAVGKLAESRAAWVR